MRSLAVVPDASNIFFSQVLRGISDLLRSSRGYSLIIADTGNDPGRERDHAEFVRAGRVDGVLLLNGRLLSNAETRAQIVVPTVSLCDAFRVHGCRMSKRPIARPRAP